MYQKLSQHTQSNFISTKAFKDNATGKIRANLMKGIHYTHIGIRVLAKEIKKSLYSSANKLSPQLDAMTKMRTKSNKNEGECILMEPTAPTSVTPAASSADDNLDWLL